jgi:hypothetical protein
MADEAAKRVNNTATKSIWCRYAYPEDDDTLGRG